MLQQDISFKPLRFLLECKSRVKNLEERSYQKLFMNIAFAYLDESDYDNAFKYFLKSVECHKDSYYLNVSITHN